MISLVLATRNPHKVQEIQAILGRRFHYFTLDDFPSAPAVTEDANSFAGNATKKAVQLARWLCLLQHSPKSKVSDESDLYVLADDSGLEVDALNGAPGVFSARFAALDNSQAPAGNSPDADNNAKLLRLLEGIPRPQRVARFKCVIALTPVFEPPDSPSSAPSLADELDLHTELFQGACPGWINTAPSGSGGFGYDPLFIPDGSEISFAELGDAAKNALSHRAHALQRLRDRFS